MPRHILHTTENTLKRRKRCPWRLAVWRPSALVSVLGLALFPGAGLWNSDCIEPGAEKRTLLDALTNTGEVAGDGTQLSTELATVLSYNPTVDITVSDGALTTAAQLEGLNTIYAAISTGNAITATIETSASISETLNTEVATTENNTFATETNLTITLDSTANVQQFSDVNTASANNVTLNAGFMDALDTLVLRS